MGVFVFSPYFLKSDIYKQVSVCWDWKSELEPLHSSHFEVCILVC